MTGVRFTELQSRPLEFLDFTSLTLDEFQQLVLPFETAFHARMAAWRMDGKPRTARRFTLYKNCPLPTPEDRLLFSPTASFNSLLKGLVLRDVVTSRSWLTESTLQWSWEPCPPSPR